MFLQYICPLDSNGKHHVNLYSICWVNQYLPKSIAFDCPAIYRITIGINHPIIFSSYNSNLGKQFWHKSEMLENFYPCNNAYTFCKTNSIPITVNTGFIRYIRTAFQLQLTQVHRIHKNSIPIPVNAGSSDTYEQHSNCS